MLDMFVIKTTPSPIIRFVVECHLVTHFPIERMLTNVSGRTDPLCCISHLSIVIITVMMMGLIMLIQIKLRHEDLATNATLIPSCRFVTRVLSLSLFEHRHRIGFFREFRVWNFDSRLFFLTINISGWIQKTCFRYGRW